MDNTYMSKETQEKRFKELIQKAEALGYTLEYDKQLDPNKRSSLWNYRYIARLKINDDISIQLDVIGDVCVYIGEDKFKDKSNSGRVGKELSAYYKSDSELYDAINSGVVELIDNNWYEYNDSNISKVKPNEVENNNGAYLLFYKLKSN